MTIKLPKLVATSVVRGSGDRGLRGITLGDEDILIAASDMLFRYDRSFKIKTFSKNHYLDDCHENCRYEQKIFLTSAGFDSLLAASRRAQCPAVS